MRTLPIPSDFPFYAVFNRNGSQLAAVDESGNVVRWSTAGDAADWSEVAGVETAAGFVPALRFLPDGRLVAFGDAALAVIGRPDRSPTLAVRAATLGDRTVLDLAVVAGTRARGPRRRARR